MVEIEWKQDIVSPAPHGKPWQHSPGTSFTGPFADSLSWALPPSAWLCPSRAQADTRPPPWNAGRSRGTEEPAASAQPPCLRLCRVSGLQARSQPCWTCCCEGLWTPATQCPRQGMHVLAGRPELPCLHTQLSNILVSMMKTSEVGFEDCVHWSKPTHHPTQPSLYILGFSLSFL